MARADAIRPDARTAEPYGAGSVPDAGGSGVGWAPSHHGELLQGVFRDRRGRPKPGLVTLPLRHRGSRACFVADDEEGVRVHPPERTKAQRAAALAVQLCAATGAAAIGGRLQLVGDVPTGWGMGSSTSDVIAAVKAVGAGYRVEFTPDRIAWLAVQAERACDSTMIDDGVVLFAHRHGTVLELLGPVLPPIAVVGCVSGPPGGVDTLRLPPPRYSHTELAAFHELRGALRRAVRTQDVGLLGVVATASARINQRRLPTPGFEALVAIAAEVGAAGVQVAHSGIVAGVVIDARLPDLGARTERCRAAMDREGLVPGESFVAGARPTGIRPGAGLSSATR